MVFSDQLKQYRKSKLDLHLRDLQTSKGTGIDFTPAEKVDNPIEQTSSSNIQFSWLTSILTNQIDLDPSTSSLESERTLCQGSRDLGDQLAPKC